MCSPLNCRGGFVTFVATKVTKKAFSRNASLPHLAFALQIRQNHGLQNVAPLRSLYPTLQQLLLCPFRRTGPPLFCLISSEAVLLTVKILFWELTILLNPDQKRAKA
jgi:hypothetical protein